MSNVQQVLVSNPDIGCFQYGLTDLGKNQALEVRRFFELRTCTCAYYVRRLGAVIYKIYTCIYDRFLGRARLSKLLYLPIIL